MRRTTDSESLHSTYTTNSIEVRKKEVAFCMGMTKNVACVVMGCIYAMAPLMYTLNYTSISNTGNSIILNSIWFAITIHAGVFFYASFLCFMNTCSPSAVYCKQLDTIQHYVWKTLALFAAICFLLSISQFVVYYRGNGYHEPLDAEIRGRAKWFNLEGIFDTKFHLVRTMLDNQNKSLEEIKSAFTWLQNLEYTAAATLLILAVISSFFAALTALIALEFEEMAEKIYEDNQKDFQRAEIFAKKMRKPEAPKCCCIFGNTTASFLMALLYLVPVFTCWYSYQSPVMKSIIEIFNTRYYLGLIFQGLAFIQVVVFLYAAILCLINACYPSLWCCKQFRTLSTYLLILVSIFTCIFLMLYIHQKYGHPESSTSIRTKITELQIEGVEKYYEIRLQVEQLEPGSAKFRNFKEKIDAEKTKDTYEIRRDVDAARNFFGIMGIAGIIFIIVLRYMENQFQAMCVYLYGFDIYEAKKNEISKNNKKAAKRKMKKQAKKEKVGSV